MRDSSRPKPDNKLPLSRSELADIIDLSLWAGQLLLQNGAASRRVEEAVHQIGTALGCDWLDVLVSYNAITITLNSGEDFRTKVRRVPDHSVNMTTVSAVYRLKDRVLGENLTRDDVRSELQRISDKKPFYNRWLIVFTIGLSCAAFSRLFGGDWIAFGITFLASSVAMFVRQELNKRYFNYLLVTMITAFVASVISCIAILLNLGKNPEIALAASVLLLVPGVPLMNAVIDLVRNYTVVGLARGITGTLIIFAIAIGMLLAIRLTGVTGL